MKHVHVREGIFIFNLTSSIVKATGFLFDYVLYNV